MRQPNKISHVDKPGKKHREEIKAIIHSYLPHCHVRVFGSRVTGKAGRFSDVDLVIEGNEELDPGLIARIKDAFRESNLPFKVDVLDWLAISDRFRDQIKQECVAL